MVIVELRVRVERRLAIAHERQRFAFVRLQAIQQILRGAFRTLRVRASPGRVFWVSARPGLLVLLFDELQFA
ncbi:MAG: hypothetical protein AUJ92_11725 [Armatimonadetes bacterium CG2_30_59_28]|nr:MAG: hypothetical protein AUJ92_11725 [Armatimonadetes bacterium CG2_30_59_28]